MHNSIAELSEEHKIIFNESQNQASSLSFPAGKSDNKQALLVDNQPIKTKQSISRSFYGFWQV